MNHLWSTWFFLSIFSRTIETSWVSLFHGDYEIKTATKHHQFDPETLENDIAILHLKTDVKLSSSVRLANLIPFEFNPYERLSDKTLDLDLEDRQNLEFVGSDRGEVIRPSNANMKLKMKASPIYPCSHGLNSETKVFIAIFDFMLFYFLAYMSTR